MARSTLSLTNYANISDCATAVHTNVSNNKEGKFNQITCNFSLIDDGGPQNDEVLVNNTTSGNF